MPLVQREPTLAIFCVGVLKLSLTGAAIMMKLLIVASAASAWSLGVPKGLPKLNNRALQQQRQQNQVIAAAPASTTALKATEVTGGAKAEDGLMETLKTGSFFALWYCSTSATTSTTRGP